MSTVPAAPARTIDEVIARLEEIIVRSVAAGDRLGYFAALYNRVTQAVKAAIAAGEFDDGPRMERLDVTFANRYLAAYDAWAAGELPTRAWTKAFAAARDGRHIVLQHLLVGMNAHINLDLGIAAARTCPGPQLAALQGDFDRINAILARETPMVEAELDAELPGFAALAGIAPKLELKLVGFAMDGAREAAWKLATELAPLSLSDQLPVMDRRDGEAALLGDVVLGDGLVVRLIREREGADVARNIEILARGEFRSRVPPLIGEPVV